MSDTNGSTSNDAFLNFELPERKLTLAFATSEDLRGWIVRELEHWQWIPQVVSMNYQPASGTLQKRQLRHLQQAQGILGNHLNAPDDARVLAETKTQIGHALAVHFRDNRAIYSQTAEGQFVGHVASAEPLEAVHVLWEFMTRHNADPLSNDYFSHRGRIKAALFDSGILEVAPTERRLLDGFAAEYRAVLAKIHGEFANTQQGGVAIRAEWTGINSATRKQFETDSVKRAADFTGELNQVKEELKKIEESYRQKLALQSSVQYWKDRADECRKAARWYAAYSIGFGLIYFGGVTPWLYTLFSSKVFPSEAAASPTWRVGIVAFVVLLGLWLLRILVRTYLSHSHLSVDAKHRSVVVLTYLSMLRDEKDAVTAAERVLVLTTVFRPASDGLIRDDGMPPTTAELASRIVEGRRP